ncbi:SusD/RagB family nutrient-binding outer membrane lipoprotein [Sediminibacterium ginsengisoli]|uniref:Starch-binding associating with outer membrane n=1 Tax=Sediminibacterium ginsengisoli TaxID=413434 RepID=A0A1T4RVD3_9BACT|nr:SusD/RagB family nutrient-binding outer membrane lipoprotein [Sediminibacterium ginsengisoli]SKA19933.1 Starch-binding associating with outer membrane [Sediminibacterium ginsengisoli]
MKKTLYLLSGIVVLLTTSCKKYLDINQNPNTATSATPELILPQALVATASNLAGNFNSYGAALVGYNANGGGYSGFGTYVTYDFTTGSYTGLWSSTYDNIQDYSYIVKSTNGQDRYAYFNAIGRIMMAHNYQLLVDAYNNVPYSDALGGASAISPKYDQGTAIYKSIAEQLDTAIILINKGLANPQTTIALTTAADPLFTQVAPPNMVLWKQYANTLKLRIMLRAGSKVTFTNTTFSADGFLTQDAIVNPGYSKNSGKQNPAWDTWAYSYTGSASGSAGLSRLPSTFALTFYDGTKLNDPRRGSVVYKAFPNTPTNQLGNETNPKPPNAASPSPWYKGTSATAFDKIGIFKGFDMGQPIMLAAESYFLQAEAIVRGLITGDAKTAFNKGIDASFNYLYLDNTGKLATTGYLAPATDAAAYRTANAGNYLADFDAANTNDKKIEAIITQKYIALNMILSHEPWNEYRRTGYPAITPGSTDPTKSFASVQSISTRPDRLPTRIPYPSSEFSTNSANVPKDVDKFSSLIFWAK